MWPTWLRSCLYRLVKTPTIKTVKNDPIVNNDKQTIPMSSQVSHLCLSKLPCTSFQSVIEISLVSCVCPFSLPLVPVPEDVPSGTSPHKRGMCNTMSTWKHTQRIPTQQQKWIMTQKSSLPCKSGEGQPTPSLNALVQRYGRLREWFWTPSSLHSRA